MLTPEEKAHQLLVDYCHSTDIRKVEKARNEIRRLVILGMKADENA
jgi:hypothetical protein